jgi:quercetin dioxygenase-like cupin family protein
VIVPLAEGEAVLRGERREVSLLAAREELTITHARYSGGERVAGPHVHHEHTDAFYVLEGELTFEVGREARAITLSAGGFLAAPPGVAHSFQNAGDHAARWLTIHARDGGFGAFMRGVRDGVEIEWDIFAVPADGGPSAATAIVSPGVSGMPDGAGNRLSRLRCVLPDLRVVEWHLSGHAELPLHQPGRRAGAFFVIDGELEAMSGGTRRTVVAGTVICPPPGEKFTLTGRGPARVLSLHTALDPG